MVIHDDDHETDDDETREDSFAKVQSCPESTLQLFNGCTLLHLWDPFPATKTTQISRIT